MKKSVGIEGMSCQHCVRRVDAALKALSGVTSVSVDLGAKSATVEGEGLDDAAIRAAVDEAGYEVTAIATA